MTDSNDSDGSWEFVDKDSDSDTSSVASPYDTGLPDENLLLGVAEDKEQNGWANNEDFITDSDIEACAEETAESEPEEIAQKEELEIDFGQGLNDHEPPEIEKNGENQDVRVPESIQQNESRDVTVNDFHEDSGLHQELENAEASLPDSCDGDALDDDTSPVDSEASDDVLRQDVPEEETLVASEVTQHVNPDLEDVVELPLRSSDSFDSEFEKVDASDHLEIPRESLETSFDTVENIGAAEVDIRDTKSSSSVSTMADNSWAGSNTGSADFTVISAPSNPPVEILSPETSYMAENTEVDVGADRRTVGIATEVDPTNRRTVGMVTEHVTPPNQKLMLSVLMISFGVGYLLGRFPLSDTSILARETPKKQEMPEGGRFGFENAIGRVYHEQEHPVLENEFFHPQFEAAVNAMKEKNEKLRSQLLEEKAKMKHQNRGLRMTIQQLKEDNDRFLTKSVKQVKELETSSLNLNLLRQSCRREEQLHEMEANVKNKEIQQLKTRVHTLEGDNSFMSRSMMLYRRLQNQHHSLLARYHELTEQQKRKKTWHVEQLGHVTTQIRKCRQELRSLQMKLIRSESYNDFLEKMVRQCESRAHSLSKVIHVDSDSNPQYLDPLPTVSPLLQALAEGSGQTCHSGSKFRTQVVGLRSRVRVQRLQIKMLEADSQLKSSSIELLYQNVEELNNYAMCLKQQLIFSPQERARDPLAFCSTTRKSASPPPTVSDIVEPHPQPQCSIRVDGALAHDLTMMNLTVRHDGGEITNYKLIAYKPPYTPALFFNATPIYADFTGPRPIKFFPPNQACALSESPFLSMSQYGTPPLPTPDSKTLPPFLPALMYHNAEARYSRARYQIIKQRSDLWKLSKICNAKDNALEGSRREKENAEHRLVAAEHEIERMQEQEMNMSQKIFNLTQVINKGPSMKQCLTSALDTDELLLRINNTKTYKYAQKMAQKVKKATNKAWNKFRKFIGKFDPDEHHGKFDEWEDGRERKHYESREHKLHGRKSKKEYSKKADEDSFGSKKSHRKQNSDEKYHKKYKNLDKPQNQPRKEHHRFRPEEKGRQSYPKNSEMKEKSCWKSEKKGKCKYQQKKGEFQEEKKRHHGSGRQGGKGFRELRKNDQRHSQRMKKSGKKIIKEDYQIKFGPENRKDKKERNRRHRFRSRDSEDYSKKDRITKKMHHFRDTVSSVIQKHVRMAAESGKKAVNQLIPIYNHWKNAHCNSGTNVLPESIKEIWCPTKEEEEDSPRLEQPTGSDTNLLNLDCGIENIVNVSAFPSPVIPWSGEVQTREDDSDLNQDAGESLPRALENEEGVVKEKMDSQWYTKMFEARESIRDWNDVTTFSEEEFDWFLKMFESREQLRKSGEDPYPSIPKASTNDDMDWFLKMFEARARIRFQHDRDDGFQKNWYLKMSEARDKARCRSSEGRVSEDWYTKMNHARERMRRGGDRSAKWYHDMAAARAKARGRWSGQTGSNGDWYLKRMKYRQSKRERCPDWESQSSTRGRMVSGLNDRERFSKQTRSATTTGRR